MSPVHSLDVAGLRFAIEAPAGFTIVEDDTRYGPFLNQGPGGGAADLRAELTFDRVDLAGRDPIFRAALSIAEEDSTSPTSELVVSRAGARSSTVTASEPPLTARAASSVTRRPTPTATPGNVLGAKPPASTDTV